MRSLPYVLASILTTPELRQDRFAAERELISRVDRAVIDLVAAGQSEGDMRAANPVSAASLVQALFDTLAAPEIVVTPDEVVEFAMTALLADPGTLPEIRVAADALDIGMPRADPPA